MRHWPTKAFRFGFGPSARLRGGTPTSTPRRQSSQPSNPVSSSRRFLSTSARSAPVRDGSNRRRRRRQAHIRRSRPREYPVHSFRRHTRVSRNGAVGVASGRTAGGTSWRGVVGAEVVASCVPALGVSTGSAVGGTILPGAAGVATESGGSPFRTAHQTTPTTTRASTHSFWAKFGSRTRPPSAEGKRHERSF
jgi:hypothetical protein